VVVAELPDNVRQYLEETRLAVFGCTNRDGSLHLTGLWYELRGDKIIMNTGAASKKVRNLKRDPRGSVCVIDHSGVCHVTLEGTVTFDDQHVLKDLVSLASRYAGADAGPTIAHNIAKIPHITLELSIERINTFGKI
jgi:PPOX class probable F420-dependent enzyme